MLVVGYPRLLPAEGPAPAVPFATGDYAWGRRIERLLNLSPAAGRRPHRRDLRRPLPAPRGHDACAGAEAWVNGNELKLGVAATYHPFQAGMRGVAAAIYEQMTGLVAPDDADAEPPSGSVVVNPEPAP